MFLIYFFPCFPFALILLVMFILFCCWCCCFSSSFLCCCCSIPQDKIKEYKFVEMVFPSMVGWLVIHFSLLLLLSSSLFFFASLEPPLPPPTILQLRLFMEFKVQFKHENKNERQKIKNSGHKFTVSDDTMIEKNRKKLQHKWVH